MATDFHSAFSADELRAFAGQLSFERGAAFAAEGGGKVAEGRPHAAGVVR